MPLIKNVKDFKQSIAVIVDVKMGIIDDMFPLSSTSFHKGEEISFDTVTVEAMSPEYSSFSRSSNVVKKDGKDVVTLKPVNFNESISKTSIDAYASRFGQNEYGEGQIDSQTQSLLDGAGKLHLRNQVGIKKMAYEALTTFKIAGGYIGENGKEDIVFNVPATNKEVFNGTTKKYWSNSVSTPCSDILRAVRSMKIKPTKVIMNDSTYANFVNNAQVLTADNSSTGDKRNFIINENVQSSDEYFTAGKLIYRGIIIDIQVESAKRLTTGGYVPYMPDGYVSYCSPLGQMNYASVPVGTVGGVELKTADFVVEEVITIDPAVHKIVVKTAPLTTIVNGEAYYSQKVEA